MREKFGAFQVLVWHFGLERLVEFPPHGAHTRPEPAFLFQFITLVKHNTGHIPENWPSKLHFSPLTGCSDCGTEHLQHMDPDLTVLVGTLILRNSASLHRTGQGA